MNFHELTDIGAECTVPVDEEQEAIESFRLPWAAEPFNVGANNENMGIDETK